MAGRGNNWTNPSSLARILHHCFVLQWPLVQPELLERASSAVASPAKPAPAGPSILNLHTRLSF